MFLSVPSIDFRLVGRLQNRPFESNRVDLSNFSTIPVRLLAVFILSVSQIEKHATKQKRPVTAAKTLSCTRLVTDITDTWLLTKIAAKCTHQNITPGNRSTTPAKYSKKYGPNLKSMRKASMVNFGQPK